MIIKFQKYVNKWKKLILMDKKIDYQMIKKISKK